MQRDVGLITGSGDMPYHHTMDFTRLMLFQMFNVINALSDRHSAFPQLFQNPLL